MKRENIPFLILAVLISLFATWSFIARNNKQTVRLGNQTFATALADSTEERIKGLSGTTSLGKNQAMLFDFHIPEASCFWMKDMNYSLDMIWMNERKQIITIHKDVSPESYPENFCTTEPARYVMEVPAGTVERLQAKLGDTVSF